MLSPEFTKGVRRQERVVETVPPSIASYADIKTWPVELEFNERLSGIERRYRFECKLIMLADHQAETN